jgi:hypothetical protein
MVALVPPKPKHAGPGAAPTLSGPTWMTPSRTAMTELPPTPAECTLLIGKEIGTPFTDPRRSVMISASRTEPTSVVVPPTSIISTCSRS